VKKVIRSLCWVDQKEKDEATKNFKTTRSDRLLNLTSTERTILEFSLEFYTRTAEAPQLSTIFDHFEGLNDPDAIVKIEEVTAETFYQGASFVDLFEGEVEEQAGQNLTQACKTAVKIATAGMKIGNNVVKGTDEAVAYLFSEAKGVPRDDTDKLKASMRKNKAALTSMYEERKANPHETYGVLTGYGLIDAATAGIRRKQLYLHAGFGGHLKSTLMLNMIINSVVDGGWNALLFTSEMPANDVQQLIISIHSANQKFNGVGRPLPAFKLLLGALNKDEEEFYEGVKEDLLTERSYGDIRVIDSSEFTSFGSVMQRTVREHAEDEVDIMWTDYVTRLPLDAKYRGIDTTTARNETIADAKRFAMSFDGGAGLAVCSPFQINREGYKKAKANEGRMDLTALAAYNAAEREADVITYGFYDEEEQATSEPKIGLLKSRWGKVNSDPVRVFIEPDSRRIFDLSAGMAVTGIIPTASAEGAEEEVEI